MPLASAARKIYWGWFVVAGAFLLMALTYGARYSFGLFVQPLAADNGWSRSVVSLAASINLLVYAAGGIWSGRLLDRVSPRWIATAGAVACAAGFFLCAGAASPLQFYLAYGVLNGFGSSWTGTVTVTSSVSKWFSRRRGTAIGISSMGVSFGTITLTPVIAYLLEHFGWLSDRIGDPKHAAALGYMFMAAGTLVLIHSRSVEALMAYALIFGFGYGCLGPLLPILTADRFGPRRMGASYGLLTFFVVGIGGSLGPIIGGLLFDTTGTYLAAWWLNAALLVATTVGIATLRRKPAGR